MRFPSPARLVAATLGTLALGSTGVIVFHTRTANAVAPASSLRIAEPTRVAPTPAATDDRSERAAELHVQAVALQKAGRARESAALHRASAALRSADDSSATRCLEAAGMLLTYAGDFADARATMRAAAVHALAGGNVARAAELTLLTGFVAREQADTAGVVGYAREARWLASAPSVTPVQRVAILSRIRVGVREPARETTP